MDEKTIILFDDYLQGELDTAKREAFEKRIENEPKLAEAFSVYKEVHVHLEHHHSKEREELKASLDFVADEHFKKINDETAPVKKEPKVIRFKPWKYSVAASVVLFMGIMLFYQFGQPDYADYAFNDAISLVERDGEALAFAKAETAFNSKSYSEAIIHFDAILAIDSTNSEVFYYKGIALVETGNYDQADAIFRELADGKTLYKNKAVWYGALSKLKQGDENECKRLLEKIPVTAEDYETAQRLLKKL